MEPKNSRLSSGNKLGVSSFKGSCVFHNALCWSLIAIMNHNSNPVETQAGSLHSTKAARILSRTGSNTRATLVGKHPRRAEFCSQSCTHSANMSQDYCAWISDDKRQKQREKVSFLSGSRTTPGYSSWNLSRHHWCQKTRVHIRRTQLCQLI